MQPCKWCGRICDPSAPRFDVGGCLACTSSLPKFSQCMICRQPLPILFGRRYAVIRRLCSLCGAPLAPADPSPTEIPTREREPVLALAGDC